MKWNQTECGHQTNRQLQFQFSIDCQEMPQSMKLKLPAKTTITDYYLQFMFGTSTYIIITVSIVKTSLVFNTVAIHMVNKVLLQYSYYVLFPGCANRCCYNIILMLAGQTN